MQTQNQPYTRFNERPPTPPAPITPKGLSAATVLLPLRIFLGISFIAAGVDKLMDKEFFDPNAIGYIGNQLAAFAKQSPIGGFLTGFAVPNATIFGALVLVGELAIGLGTLVGLFSRTAAFFGFILSMTLWLTATWEVAPFFLGSDLPYAIGWLTLALAGAHPVLSLDGQIKRAMTLSQAERAIKFEGAPADSGLPRADTAVLAFDAENPQEQATLARKRFVLVAGATVLASAITGVAWANTLESKAEAQSSGTGQANPTPATPEATASSAPTTAPATTTSVATTAPTTQTAQANTSAPAANTTTAPATAATSKPTVAPTATKAPTTSAAAKGPVLAALSSIPVGEAKAFTTPDTKQPAFLVHETDGSVKAFSAICTHEGCEVSYSKSNQLFVCPCHGAQFNASTGAVVRGPARRPLASFKVQVDNGNIVYTQG